MAFKRKSEREYDQRVTQAWLMAKLSRAERVPKLETLLLRDTTAEKQSVGELRSMVETLSQLYHLKLKKKKAASRGE